MSKVAVALAPGFEEVEALTIVDVLRRCGVEVITAGLGSSPIEGAHQVKVIPDIDLDSLNIEDYDAFVLPGGAPGYENLRKDQRVIDAVKRAFEEKKIVAAMCASPSVLSDAGVLRGKKATIYPGMEDELRKGGAEIKEDLVVQDGNIVTSRGPATAVFFALKLGEILASKSAAEEVKKQMLVDLVIK